MRFRAIAIIGVGMIGGSVGLAVRQRGLSERIVGIGRREESLRRARQLGVVDQTTTDLESGVRSADLIVVCSPIPQVADHLLAAARHCPSGALLTDAASTKRRIVEQVDRQLDRSRDVQFVGSHPIAGSDQTGPEAARADLFQQRLVVITPSDQSNPNAVARIDAFWQSLGAKTAHQDPAEHDRVLSGTSHMPHVVASALAACTAEHELPFVGSGWCDTTRIAKGAVSMWQEILADNKQDVLRSIDKFMQSMDQFRTAIKNNDDQELIRLLTAGKKQRDAVGS